LKLLANENFPLDSVKYLLTKGFDVISIGKDYAGYKDKEIIDLAQKEERIILTFDRDYGELIFKHNYQPERGVIYLRLDKYEPDEPGKITEHLLSVEKIVTDRTLTVFDGETIRQRKY
jgi:predicted nuclease of predicted toxin-antitoxin system